MERLNVLIVDPWGINNTSEYLNGLVFGLSKKTDLVVCTNYQFKITVNADVEIDKCFFRFSETMRKGKLRSLVRGIEYLLAYVHIIKKIQKQRFDIVHFNWLLNYKADIFFLRIIKRYCNKIVYTAHNVMPHISGEKKKHELQVIYDTVNCIIVHGNSVKKEMEELFPKTKGKIYVQRHGCILHNPNPTSEKHRQYFSEIKNEYHRIIACCGAVFYNKGMDRLGNIWIQEFKNNPEVFLIMGGKQDEEYSEYTNVKEKLKNIKNIKVLDGFIDNDFLEAVFSECDGVILPYRKASMSGVVFSAAQHGKMIIATDVGAIPEYLENNEDSIICLNDEQSIINAIYKFLKLDLSLVDKMGDTLKTNIAKKCDWEIICNGIVCNVYLK